MLSFLIERNIVNLQELPQFLKKLETRAETESGKKWITSTLRNWMINKFPGAVNFAELPQNVQQKYTQEGPEWLPVAIQRGDELFFLDFKSQAARDVEQEIEHVIDYFNANPEERLDRVSVEAAKQAADRWVERRNRKIAADEDAAGVKSLVEFPDEYRWVEVVSPEALDREGKLMKHCVGSYAQRVASGHVTIYSLRDPMNKPHVTIELRKEGQGDEEDNLIQQVKGNANTAPKKEYVPYIGALFTKYNLRVGSGGKNDLQKISPTIHVMANGRAIDLGHLQGSFKGDLYLDASSMRVMKAEEKPNDPVRLGQGTDATIDGDFYFDDDKTPNTYYEKKKTGPLIIGYKKLHVTGDVGIGSHHPVMLPDTMVVDGDLDLHRLHAVKLPKNLQVSGDFRMPPSVHKLPEQISVKGTVHAPNSLRGKVSFPADLTVAYV